MGKVAQRREHSALPGHNRRMEGSKDRSDQAGYQTISHWSIRAIRAVEEVKVVVESGRRTTEAVNLYDSVVHLPQENSGPLRISRPRQSAAHRRLLFSGRWPLQHDHHRFLRTFVKQVESLLGLLERETV